MSTEKQNDGNHVANQLSDLLGGFVSNEELKNTAKEVGLKVTENTGGNENQNEEVEEEEQNENENQNSEEEVNEEEEQNQSEENEEEQENEEEEESEQEQEEGAEGKDGKGKKKPAKKEDPVAVKNKFGLGPKKNNEPEKKINISKLEEVIPTIKSEFGIQVKGVKDIPKFFESAQKWRADSQALKKTKEDLDTAMYYWNNLPEDLVEAVKLHYNNQDYKGVFDKPALDFSKAVDKQDIKKLVTYYFPEKNFKDEDFEAAEKSDALQIAETAAKKQYVTDKGIRDSRAEQSVKSAQEKTKAFTASIASSVENFKTSFPDADEEALEATKDLFVSGKVMALFFNPDGTLKPDALKRAMLATNGEDLIVDLMEIAQKRGESSANEEHVLRSASKQKTPKGKGKDPVRQKVKDQLQESVGGQRKQYTY